MTASRGIGDAKHVARQSVSLAKAAESGDILATLTALRDRLAIELDFSKSNRDIAVLSARLATVLGQIEELRPPRRSRRDEIVAKRAARLAAAAAGHRTETTGGSS